MITQHTVPRIGVLLWILRFVDVLYGPDLHFCLLQDLSCSLPAPPIDPSPAVIRVGNWFKPPGLNHGLNRLKFNAFMPLAGINSNLPGLNRFKPVKTTGWHKLI